MAPVGYLGSNRLEERCQHPCILTDIANRRFALKETTRDSVNSSVQSDRVNFEKGSLIRPDDLPPDLLQQHHVLLTPATSDASRDEIKKQQLIQALEKAGGNQTRAAQILGVTRVTVWNRMKRYGVTANRTFSASTKPL